jgi:microcystin-dependent protein
VLVDGVVAQIMMFGGDFAPRGWALCDGRLLSITQFEVLFAVIGNRFGGDGRSTFALPDLRGRVPVGSGGATRRALDRLRRRTAFEATYVICVEGSFPTRP